MPTTFSIYPLGDSAITVDLGNCIDEQLNRKTLAIHDWLQAHRFPGIADIIMAYSSVSVYYDPVLVRMSKVSCPGGVYSYIKGLLEQACEAMVRTFPADGTGFPAHAVIEGHDFRIPVCYEGEYAPDLEWVAIKKGLTCPEIIALHTAGPYRIYMIGFLPGFPYMGKIDYRLEIPRKERPVPIIAGGVGIAGMQTGIYPLNSPGGWQIIGRTPLRLFDRNADPPIRLQSGDRVQFYPISKAEFLDLRSSGGQLSYTG